MEISHTCAHTHARVCVCACVRMEYAGQRKWHLKGPEKTAHTRNSEKFWMIVNRSKPDEDRGGG